MKKINQNFAQIFLVSLTCFALTAPNLSLAAESVIENPSDGVINLPIELDSDLRPHVKAPWARKKRPLRVVVTCQLEQEEILIVKENQVKSGLILDPSTREVNERVDHVQNLKISKDMLGQYSAAVTIAQQLGITEVDYVKIFPLIPMKLDLRENRLNVNSLTDSFWRDSRYLIIFYDNDDDIIDRTLVQKNQWLRCLNSESIELRPNAN